MAQTFYEILGLSKDADAKEIKDTFRKLAKKYHPDVNPGDNEAEKKFKEITLAYETLNDPDKRRAYDNGNINEQGDVEYSRHNDPFQDFINAHFSGFRQQHVAIANTDIAVNLMFDPLESFQEQTKQIEYTKIKFCADCNGKGGKDGEVTCPDCMGRKHKTQHMGHMIVQTPCDRCQQRGFIFKQACTSCKGFGAKQELVTHTIKIPIGACFKTLRVEKAGNQNNPNQPAGDLYISVILPNPYKNYQFSQDGTIYTEITVDPIEAMLGVEKEVYDIKGEKIKLNIPSMCQNKQFIRIQNHGLAIDKNTRGYFAVIINHDYSTVLSEKQKEILKQYIKEKEVKEK